MQVATPGVPGGVQGSAASTNLLPSIPLRGAAAAGATPAPASHTTPVERAQVESDLGLLDAPEGVVPITKPQQPAPLPPGRPLMHSYTAGERLALCGVRGAGRSQSRRPAPPKGAVSAAAAAAAAQAARAKGGNPTGLAHSRPHVTRAGQQQHNAIGTPFSDIHAMAGGAGASRGGGGGGGSGGSGGGYRPKPHHAPHPAPPALSAPSAESRDLIERIDDGGLRDVTTELDVVGGAATSQHPILPSRGLRGIEPCDDVDVSPMKPAAEAPTSKSLHLVMSATGLPCPPGMEGGIEADPVSCAEDELAMLDRVNLRCRSAFAALLTNQGGGGGGVRAAAGPGLSRPRSYASSVVLAEVLMRQAEVATRDLPTPNPLRTAVACYALDRVTADLTPAYRRVFSQIARDIYPAVFSDYASVKDSFASSLPPPSFAEQCQPLSLQPAPPPADGSMSHTASTSEGVGGGGAVVRSSSLGGSASHTPGSLGYDTAAVNRYMGSQLVFQSEHRLRIELDKCKKLCAFFASSLSKNQMVLKRSVDVWVVPQMRYCFKIWRHWVKTQKREAWMRNRRRVRGDSSHAQAMIRLSFSTWRNVTFEGKIRNLSEREAALAFQLENSNNQFSLQCFKAERYLITIDELRENLEQLTANLVNEKRKNYEAAALINVEHTNKMQAIQEQVTSVSCHIHSMLSVTTHLMHTAFTSDVPDSRFHPAPLCTLLPPSGDGGLGSPPSATQQTPRFPTATGGSSSRDPGAPALPMGPPPLAPPGGGAAVQQEGARGITPASASFPASDSASAAAQQQQKQPPEGVGGTTTAAAVASPPAPTSAVGRGGGGGGGGGAAAAAPLSSSPPPQDGGAAAAEQQQQQQQQQSQPTPLSPRVSGSPAGGSAAAAAPSADTASPSAAAPGVAHKQHLHHHHSPHSRGGASPTTAPASPVSPGGSASAPPPAVPSVPALPGMTPAESVLLRWADRLIGASGLLSEALVQGVPGAGAGGGSPVGGGGGGHGHHHGRGGRGAALLRGAEGEGGGAFPVFGLVTNFGSDWANGMCYAVLLNAVAPSACHLASLQEKPWFRLQQITESAKHLGISGIPHPADIAAAVSDLNYLFLSGIFEVYALRRRAREEASALKLAASRSARSGTLSGSTSPSPPPSPTRVDEEGRAVPEVVEGGEAVGGSTSGVAEVAPVVDYGLPEATMQSLGQYVAGVGQRVASLREEIAAAEEREWSWRRLVAAVVAEAAHLRSSRSKGKPIALADTRQMEKFTKLPKARLRDLSKGYTVTQQMALASDQASCSFDKMVDSCLAMLKAHFQEIQRVFVYYSGGTSGGTAASNGCDAFRPDSPNAAAVGGGGGGSGSGGGGGGSAMMSAQKFWRFVSDLRCLDKDLTTAAVSALFVKVNQVEGGGAGGIDASQNPDTELTPIEFAEVLVRMADVKIVYEPHLNKRLEAFLFKYVFANAAQERPDNKFRSQVFEKPVQLVLHKHSRDLYKVFKQFSEKAEVSDTPKQLVITINGFIRLLDEVSLLTPPLDDQAVGSVFQSIRAASTSMPQEEETGAPEFAFHQFLEVVVACSVYRHPCPFTPLDKKLVHFLTADVLVPFKSRLRQIGIKLEVDKPVPMR